MYYYHAENFIPNGMFPHLFSLSFIPPLDVMIVTSSNYQHAGSSTINPSTASSLASSRANSPSFVRRDSILKRAGSVKGDPQQKKNVSIVTDLPSVEVVSERKKHPSELSIISIFYINTY